MARVAPSVSAALHLSAEPAVVQHQHLDADGDGGVSIQEFVGLVWERKLVLLRKKFTAAAYVKELQAKGRLVQELWS